MRQMVSVVVVVLAGAILAAQEATPCDHTKWVDGILQSVQTIKPGMTRNGLLNMMTTEGGMSSRLHRTYVFKQCPYVKIDVDCVAVADEENNLIELPEDKIVKVSRPYLEWSVMD